MANKGDERLGMAEFERPALMGAQLVEFLERLGRDVESLKDNRLLARHQGALGAEERKFNVVRTADDRFYKTVTNVVAPGIPLPDDLDQYPETYYFDDFLDRTIQAERLAKQIQDDPDIQAQREFFVPQHAAADGERIDEDSVSYFRRWLRRPASRLLAVLAPAGYGKTALTCEMSHLLAEDYLDREDGSGQPFPFLVPFGEFRRLATFEAMILSSLQRQGVTDYTEPAFSYLVSRRRAVLMLDGFDELLEERPEEARKNLRELIEQLHGRGKVVVTARSTFFRTSDDVADFLEYGLDSEQVDVIELLAFDRSQRAEVLSKRLPTQKQIANISRFVEAENVSEIMGSPLLLRETVDALTASDEETRLDRTAGRANLFEALEHSVYARERRRHGHLFTDETQQAFLERLAHALFEENERGFDFTLVQVLAHEVAAEEDPEDADLAQLADHHFLTVAHQSDAVRFNHQVFREYFQARALITACGNQGGSRVFGLLSQRPVPEEVGGFLEELDPAADLPRELLTQVKGLQRPTERLVSHLGSLVSAYRDRELLIDFLNSLPAEVGLQFDIVGLDLGDMDLSDRVLLGMSFVNCSLEGAVFDRCAIADLSLTGTDVTGASFRDATIDSIVISGGPRIFGTPDAYDALEQLGAECGTRGKERVAGLRASRREELVEMIHDRLYRFYRPGQAGPEGSKWDSSIKENNLYGGVAPSDRKFTKKALIPAMKAAGLISARRAHNEVIIDLENDGEDDARALIERGEVRGRVRDALEKLE